jgi:hypothetical protein
MHAFNLVFLYFALLLHLNCSFRGFQLQTKPKEPLPVNIDWKERQRINRAVRKEVQLRQKQRKRYKMSAVYKLQNENNNQLSGIPYFPLFIREKNASHLQSSVELKKHKEKDNIEEDDEDEKEDTHEVLESDENLTPEQKRKEAEMLKQQNQGWLPLHYQLIGTEKLGNILKQITTTKLSAKLGYLQSQIDIVVANQFYPLFRERHYSSASASSFSSNPNETVYVTSQDKNSLSNTSSSTSIIIKPSVIQSLVNQHYPQWIHHNVTTATHFEYGYRIAYYDFEVKTDDQKQAIRLIHPDMQHQTWIEDNKQQLDDLFSHVKDESLGATFIFPNGTSIKQTMLAREYKTKKEKEEMMNGEEYCLEYYQKKGRYPWQEESVKVEIENYIHQQVKELAIEKGLIHLKEKPPNQPWKSTNRFKTRINWNSKLRKSSLHADLMKKSGNRVVDFNK